MLWLVNIFAYIINAVVVGLSQTGVWGKTNAEVSDDNLTLLTPVGWAFSIWGLIFLGELLFVIWGICNRDDKIISEGVGPWFAFACVLQAIWSVLFAQELLVASAVVLCLIALSLGLSVAGLTPFTREIPLPCLSLTFYVVHFPIGIHAGWTLAAALVNVNIALQYDTLTGEVTGLILSLTGAAVAAVIASTMFNSQSYLGAIVWALAGIGAKDAYRERRLGSVSADGVDDAITGLWIALIVIGLLSLIGNCLYSQKAHEREVHGSPRDQDLTAAIYNP